LRKLENHIIINSKYRVLSIAYRVKKEEDRK